MHHRLCYVLVPLWLLGLASPLSAQVQPSHAQLELNERAYDAFLNKDFVKAARLYRASLDLGPLNITQANYGFALYKQGKCEDAHRAYIETERAPQVLDPPPEEVQATLEKYKSILHKTCGEVVLPCEEGLEVSVDRRPRRLCSEVRWLSPGRHILTAHKDRKRVVEDVQIQANEKTHVVFSWAMKAPADLFSEAPPQDESRWNAELGYQITGIAGGVFLAGAGLMEVLVLQPEFDALKTLSGSRFDAQKDSLEEKQSLTRGLLYAGSALSLTAVVLYLLVPDDLASQSALDVRWSSQGAEASWQVSF